MISWNSNSAVEPVESRRVAEYLVFDLEEQIAWKVQTEMQCSKEQSEVRRLL
jgi:hypothetical protein